MRRFESYGRTTIRRHKLWDSGHRFCCYCECRMTRPTKNEHSGPMTATLEHLQPSSKGGATSKRNTSLACRDCNELKGDLTYEQFAEAAFLLRDLGLPVIRKANGHVRWIGSHPQIAMALGLPHTLKADFDPQPVPAAALT